MRNVMSLSVSKLLKPSNPAIWATAFATVIGGLVTLFNSTVANEVLLTLSATALAFVLGLRIYYLQADVRQCRAEHGQCRDDIHERDIAIVMLHHTCRALRGRRHVDVPEVAHLLQAAPEEYVADVVQKAEGRLQRTINARIDGQRQSDAPSVPQGGAA